MTFGTRVKGKVGWYTQSPEESGFTAPRVGVAAGPKSKRFLGFEEAWVYYLVPRHTGVGRLRNEIFIGPLPFPDLTASGSRAATPPGRTQAAASAAGRRTAARPPPPGTASSAGD